jgi:hypothetical protein
MSDDTTPTERDEREKPGFAQRLHAATGDRDAEAAALARQAGDVDLDDAKIAVQRAHGEAGVGQPVPAMEHPDEELAEPSDAEEVHEERHR